MFRWFDRLSCRVDVMRFGLIPLPYDTCRRLPCDIRRRLLCGLTAAGFLPSEALLMSLILYHSGSHLLSHAVSSIVPSAARVLTVVFGMGTGVPGS